MSDLLDRMALATLASTPEAWSTLIHTRTPTAGQAGPITGAVHYQFLLPEIGRDKFWLQLNENYLDINNGLKEQPDLRISLIVAEIDVADWHMNGGIRCGSSGSDWLKAYRLCMIMRGLMDRFWGENGCAYERVIFSPVLVYSLLVYIAKYHLYLPVGDRQNMVSKQDRTPARNRFPMSHKTDYFIDGVSRETTVEIPEFRGWFHHLDLKDYEQRTDS